MSASDLLEIITSRRSIRSFQEKEIPDSTIEKLIEAARWAPSAGNCQPLEIILVKNKGVKKALAEGANQSFIESAPIVFVLCANVPRTTNRYGDRGRKMYIFNDIAASTQNLLLMAHTLQLAAVWVGAFDDARVSEVVRLPRHVTPVSIVPVGFPPEDLQERSSSRRTSSEIVHLEHW